MNSETHHHYKHRGPWGGRRRFWKAPLILLFIFAKAAIVMLLWNALIPDLFQGPVVSYLQALGLMILAKVLVGMGHRHCHGRHHGMHRHFWKHMSDEERMKLREDLHRRGRD